MPTNHFVAIAVAETSHFGAVLQLSLNLLTLHPSLRITFLLPDVAETTYNRAWALQPDSLKYAIRDRFRIVEVDTDRTDQSFENAAIGFIAFQKSLGPVVRKLVDLEEIQDEGWNVRPCCFLADVSQVFSRSEQEFG